MDIFWNYTLVYHESVLLMISNVTALSKWLWNHELQMSGSAVNFDNAMTKFICNKTTDT